MTLLRAHRTGPADSAGVPPLILLHAFPLHAAMWEPVTRLLDVPALAIDLPGFGESPDQESLSRDHGLPVASSMGVSAREVVHLLEAEGIERAVVAGVSMGGYVAMALAELAPETLAGIALLDTKSEADEEGAKVERLRMASTAETMGPAVADGMAEKLVGETTRERRPEVVEQARTLIAQASGNAIAAAQRAMAMRPDRGPALEELGRRQVPALVLRGAEDAQASAESAQRMAEALGVEPVTIDGAGHLTPLEAPERVAELLRDLVARAAGTPAG